MWYYWGGPIIAAFCFLLIGIILFYGLSGSRYRSSNVVLVEETYQVRPVQCGGPTYVTRASVVAATPIRTNGVIVTNPESAPVAREMANRESPPPAVVVVDNK